jgi:phosphatidylglycerophosphate synthase
LNRRISIPISRILSRLHISPNLISVFNLLLGLVTGVLFASTEHVMIAIGGILFQLGSILDGCDGEVTRLTFRQSDYGQWVDTVTDNISYLAFLIGLIAGQLRRVPSLSTAILGIIAVVSILMALLIMYQRINAMGKGSLLDFQIPNPDTVGTADARFFRLYEVLHTFIRRDVFALWVCMLAILNLPGVIFTFWVGGCVGLLVAVLHITSARVQRQIHIPVAVVREPVE